VAIAHSEVRITEISEQLSKVDQVVKVKKSLILNYMSTVFKL